MTKEEIWSKYIELDPLATSYDAWSFCGGGPLGDALAELVLEGKKTATASIQEMYELENCPLPPVGGLNIILKSNNDAACIIKTTLVEIYSFNNVPAEHAYKEGEGDRSLAYWRNVHETAFTQELEENGLSFHDDMLVVCETFEVVLK